MSRFKIFIVEDETWFADILKYHLSLNPDNEVHVFETGAKCISNLDKSPSMITLDYGLPDINGLELLNQIKESAPDVPVIVISGQEEVSTAVDILKSGAYDYLVKDDAVKDRIWNIASNIRSNVDLQSRVEELEIEVQEKYNFSNSIIGASHEMDNVFKMMQKALSNDIVVSIKGETGTGKELVAKTIHYNSNRKKHAFVPINVTAIPSELIESELFGHEKGAFTGAHSRRIGIFERAHKGTVFLDEIGDLDHNLQVKLLRVLQEQELIRVGGETVIKFDSRVMIATHNNLLELVKQGKFRQDLFYRLMGITVDLPPLRERGKDIILIADSILKNFQSKNKLPKKPFSTEALEKLQQYSYPGNVRELKAIVELAIVLEDGPEITSKSIILEGSANTLDLLGHERTLKQYTDEIIQHYLDKHNGNVKVVANKLDIGKSTIYKLLQEEKEGKNPISEIPS